MLDTLGVLNLVTHERQARDRGWWHALERCYTSDATIQSSWFDGTATEYIALSKEMDEHTPSSHRLGQPVIDVNGDRAVAEVPMTIEFRGVFRGVEIDLAGYISMLHRVERSGDGWRYAASVAVFARDTMVPAVPGAGLVLEPADLDGVRTSYRMLTLWMTDRGYTVPQDLYGIDRPADVAALHRDFYAWAGLPTG